MRAIESTFTRTRWVNMAHDHCPPRTPRLTVLLAVLPSPCVASTWPAILCTNQNPKRAKVFLLGAPPSPVRVRFYN
jgi:hypothetical protein